MPDGLASSRGLPDERIIVSTIRATRGRILWPCRIESREECAEADFNVIFGKYSRSRIDARAIIHRGDHCRREIVFRQLDFRRLRLVNPTRRVHNGRTPRGQLYTSRHTYFCSRQITLGDFARFPHYYNVASGLILPDHEPVPNALSVFRVATSARSVGGSG